MAYERYCDIDVTLTALKNIERDRPIVPVVMKATFHRNYTEGQLPDWTITRLDIDVPKIG